METYVYKCMYIFSQETNLLYIPSPSLSVIYIHCVFNRFTPIPIKMHQQKLSATPNLHNVEYSNHHLSKAWNFNVLYLEFQIVYKFSTRFYIFLLHVWKSLYTDFQSWENYICFKMEKKKVMVWLQIFGDSILFSANFYRDFSDQLIIHIGKSLKLPKNNMRHLNL